MFWTKFISKVASFPVFVKYYSLLKHDRPHADFLLDDNKGHPDNVAPVIYGGCQLGIHNHKRWITERVHLPPGIQVTIRAMSLPIPR